MLSLFHSLRIRSGAAAQCRYTDPSLPGRSPRPQGSQNRSFSVLIHPVAFRTARSSGFHAFPFCRSLDKANRSHRLDTLIMRHHLRPFPVQTRRCNPPAIGWRVAPVAVSPAPKSKEPAPLPVRGCPEPRRTGGSQPYRRSVPPVREAVTRCTPLRPHPRSPRPPAR